MKKLVSLLLMVTMIVTCFSASLTVSADDPTANTILLTHDFPGDGTNSAIDSDVWLSKNAAISAPRVDKNTASIYSETTTGVLWVWSVTEFAHNLTSPITKGKVLFSFDVNPGSFATTTEIDDRTFEMFVSDSNYEVSDGNSNYSSISKAAGIRLHSKKSSSINTRFEPGWGNAFSTNSTQVLNVSEAGWHHVDVLVDMDAKTLKTYLDNSLMISTKNSISIESVNSLIFKSNLNTNCVFLDNVKIIQNPEIVATNVDPNEDANYVDVEFNYEVLALPSTSDVTITNAYGGGKATITSVTRLSSNAVRVSYTNLDSRSKHAISINNVSSIAGNTTVSGIFETALFRIYEDFSNAEYNSTTGAINDWMKVTNTSKTTVSTEGGKLTVTQTGNDYAKSIRLYIRDASDVKTLITNIYKSIRNGGATGTFTASTTHLGRLSYEFDVTAKQNSGTILMYTDTNSGMRIFRIAPNTNTTSTSYGFYAGTDIAQRLTSFTPNTAHKVQIVFNFETQKVEYYLDREALGTRNFTDAIYWNNRQLVNFDPFMYVYLGVFTDTTAEFDNFVIKYYADGPKTQNLTVANEGSDYTVTGEIVNPFNTAIDSSVIFALYDADGDLANVQISSKPTTTYGQTILNETFTVPDDVAYTSGEIFVWNMNNLDALCKSHATE